jgi:hypothetical protein
MGVQHLENDGRLEVADDFLVIPHVLRQLVGGDASPAAAHPHASVVPAPCTQTLKRQTLCTASRTSACGSRHRRWGWRW